MENERSTASPSIDISCLSRVEGPSLDPQKNWYVLTSVICGTRRISDFAKSVGKIFPDDIKNAEARELLHARANSGSPAFLKNYSRFPSKLYVASTFGLVVGLLRQKEISFDGVVRSRAFVSLARRINSVALDLEPQEGKDIDSGGNTFESKSAQLMAELAERNALIESLEIEIKTFQEKVSDLESDMEKLQSLSSSPEPSSDESIEEIQSSPDNGSTTKKRKVLKKCREVMASLSDVSEKYKQSISCVLGNSFLFGDESEKGEVRDTISEVVEMVMEAKGSKKGFSEILSSSTYDRIMKSMRVPDWVLLYFKLHSRLPDSAWQTLLNLSQLGKSGVS